MSTRIGRNDPCPCGSGKKYKKCCLERGDREGNEGFSDPEMARFFDELAGLMAETAKLHDQFKWKNPFHFDPYDPVVIECLVDWEDGSAEELEEHIAQVEVDHSERLTTLAIRADLARQARGFLRRSKPAESQRKLLGLTIDVLTDLDANLLMLGLVRWLFREAMSTAMEEFQDEREQPAIPCEAAERFVQQLSASRRKTDDQAVTGLIALGEQALPAIEEFCYELDAEEDGAEHVVRGLIEVLAGIPGHRSLNSLIEMFDDDAIWEPVIDELGRAIAQHGDLARERLLLEASRDWMEAPIRLALISILIELEEPQTLDLIVNEIGNVHDDWEDDYLADHLIEDLMEWLEELGDLRTPGKLFRLLLSGDMSVRTKESLRLRLLRGLWGEEAEGALARHEAGLPIFIEASVKPGEMVLNCLHAVLPARLRNSLKSMAELQPYMEQAQAIANLAYHEANDWASPGALYSPGPEERAVMQCFSKALGRATPPNLSGQQAIEWQKSFQSEWMHTRCAELGDRFPMAMVFREQVARSPAPFLTRRYHQEELMKTFRTALERLDQGDIAFARRAAELMLTIEPDHPFGKLLADEANSILRIA